MRSVTAVALAFVVLAVALAPAFASADKDAVDLDISIGGQVDKISQDLERIFGQDANQVNKPESHSLSEVSAEAEVDRRRWWRPAPRRHHRPAPRRHVHRPAPRRHAPRRHHGRRHGGRGHRGRRHRGRRHRGRRHARRGRPARRHHRRHARKARRAARKARRQLRRIARAGGKVSRKVARKIARKMARAKRVHVPRVRPAHKVRIPGSNKRISIPPRKLAKLRAIKKYIRSHPASSPAVQAMKAKAKGLIKSVKQANKLAKAEAKTLIKQAKAAEKAIRTKKIAKAKAKVLKKKLKRKMAKAKAKAAVKKANSKPNPVLVKKYQNMLKNRFKKMAHHVQTVDMPRDLAVGGDGDWIPHFIGKKPDLRMPRPDASEDWKPLAPLFKNMSIANHDASADALVVQATNTKKDTQEVIDMFPQPIYPTLGTTW